MVLNWDYSWHVAVDRHSQRLSPSPEKKSLAFIRFSGRAIDAALKLFAKQAGEDSFGGLSLRSSPIFGGGMEIRTIGNFLSYYENVRGRTIRVIKHVPRNKIDWTYKEGKFTLRI
jgi:hypothetical protein